MRKVVAYKNYFLEFYQVQTAKVQEKIEWTLALIRDLPVIPEKYLKHLEGSDGLFEIRVQVSSNIYRIFCFFDEGQLVVLGNAFQKKTQQTPQTGIRKSSKN